MQFLIIIPLARRRAATRLAMALDPEGGGGTFATLAAPAGRGPATHAWTTYPCTGRVGALIAYLAERHPWARLLPLPNDVAATAMLPLAGLGLALHDGPAVGPPSPDVVKPRDAGDGALTAARSLADRRRASRRAGVWPPVSNGSEAAASSGDVMAIDVTELHVQGRPGTASAVWRLAAEDVGDA